MAINVEEVKIVYIPDAKSGQSLIDQFSEAKKQMEDYMEQVASWVGKVNSNMEKTNQTLDEIKEDNKKESEKLSEKLNNVDESIEILRKMHTEHMEWHNKNKSVLSKIFGK